MEEEQVKKTTRTTVILPETLDRNLELLALTHRRAKGELIREAVTDYIKKQGLSPERVPSISISYAETSDAR